MLDLQKAFDTVNHHILCEKLSVIGVESVEWFYSYLSNRRQVVHINGVESNYLNVLCGVPQHSILGPLLFLCYINDMVVSVDPESKLLLYADDSTILFSHTDPDFISKKLGKVLESCSRWLVDNKLYLHFGKTECTIFGSKRKHLHFDQFNVECLGQTIKGQDSVKYLGVQIDQTVSGEDIANGIIQKANSRMKFMYRQSNCLNQNSRKILCSALIQCHFDYACSSWYSGLGQRLKQKLQITQNKMVRFILNLSPRSHVGYAELASLLP